MTLHRKMLLFTVGIVAALLALTLVVIRSFVAAHVEEAVTRDLFETRSVYTQFMHERGRWLQSQTQVVAEDPRFVATLDIPDAELAQHARTVIPVAKQFQAIVGSDLFMATNASGQVLARANIHSMAGGAALPLSFSSVEATRYYMEMWDERYDVVQARSEAGTDLLGFTVIGLEQWASVPDALRFVAAVAEDETTREHMRSGAVPRSFLDQIQHQVAADWVALTDAEGIPLGLIRCQVDFGEDLSANTRIAAARNGAAQAIGLHRQGQRLFQTVVVPVWSQDQVVGTLSTGFVVDDRLAQLLRGMTHSHVSFVLDRTIVASTWGTDQRLLLQRQLESEPWPDYTDAPMAVSLAGETYLTLTGPLAEAETAGSGVVVFQVSLDEASAFLTTVEHLLVVVGLGVLSVALALSLVGVGRIVRPIQLLLTGTRRLAAGEWSHRIPVEGGGEVGELAGSFNEMAASLAQSLDALRGSEQRYRDLFDNALDLVFTADRQFCLTSVNAACRSVLGREPAELQGVCLYDLLDPADAERLRSRNDHFRPGGPRPAFEAAFLRPNGDRVTLEVATRWILEEGEPTGVHGIARDISERREREEATARFREQLYQAEKLRALGEMAAGVAHNFNNLLTIVLGNAELIGMREELPEEIREDTARILDSARRCSAIVRRIQTFGRPVDLAATERVNLAQVIRDTVEITQPKWKSEAGREGRVIELDLNLELAKPLDGLASVWEEILSNLIFNAVDAMPHGGTITIGARLKDDEVEVTVADTGSGMDEKTQARVFEPFFSTKGDRGTGLGLSTVWGMIQRMGGRVEIDSRPGEGTTFLLRVPASDASAHADAAFLPSETEWKLEILVVDDEAHVLEILTPMLAGNEVTTAQNGRDALERLGEREFDLVMCDWIMGDISGLEVAETVKRRRRQTVVVLMTGWELKDTAADRHPAIDLVLPKPFDREEVEQVLAAAIVLCTGGR